ncbi:AtpZ/AtpI family protein [Candidatus Saccharibacteria bacterium]|nr:AtpZ/AtpI family protein [Candidatus Saccharibacteria bacterium]
MESKESPRPTNGGQKSNEVETMKVLLGTIGDTTWRMFVPSVGFTLLGVYLDEQFQTKPWLMIIGILIGFLGAFLLVKAQVGRLKKTKKDSR